MKHEWRKSEKSIYLPKKKPEVINIPGFKYFTIEGDGNPNDDHFPEYVGVLYSLSYAVKMSPKKGLEPNGFFDYTVYPLEGVWGINDEAKKNYNGTLNKDDLVFKLMIRQPDFVNDDYAIATIERLKKDKPHDLLHKVKFETISEGMCVQMMHIGSYDNEPESFHEMEKFATTQNLVRKSKIHKEIYLSDVRKVEQDKLKTVLRFEVDQ
ncbi:MAG: GyrI-like domain-containing protein [Bacteroidales bacterium]|nr:GyrI-like domain-containing protein [Bacteroidales bacterium]